MVTASLSILFIMPVAAGCLAGLVRSVRALGVLTAFCYVPVLAAAVTLVLAQPQSSWADGLIYVDALSAWFILLTALVSFLTALYAVQYVRASVDSGEITANKGRFFYALFNACVLAMLAVTAVDNLGMMWAAVELTTLASAFLVGFHHTRSSVEAAWKYLIICSVGITLALFGIVLLYHTASHQAGVHSLNWTALSAAAPWFDPKTVRIAMVFLLIGFGTKAGFAPMHTWLPDAHSQAFSPVSALLSGALIKTSLYALIRSLIVVNRCIGPEAAGAYLVGFGCLSLVIAAAFMLVQKDIKRLLAYSSIEHMGVITVGLGIGGPLGITGALWHALNHAGTKALMFFGAATAVRHYRTHAIAAIRGMLTALPFTGVCVLAGVAALGGMPPFAIFFSELTILIAGFQAQQYAVCAIVLVSLAVAFGALIWHFSRMLFHVPPEGVSVHREPLSAKLAFVCAFIVMTAAGLSAAPLFGPALQAAVAIVTG